MSVRVNLMMPHEIQQQAAVSRGFLVRGAGLLGTAAAVLAVGFLLFHYRQVHGEHARLQSAWTAIEADYLAVKEIADEQAVNVNLVRELDGWRHSRLEWDAPLAAFQTVVPDNLQFTRLAIAGEVAVSQAEPATEDYAGTPARKYTVRLEGRAVGSLSDQDVIAFVERLRKAQAIAPWMESVRLQGMQRDPGAEEEARQFRVNGTSQERLMK